MKRNRLNIGKTKPEVYFTKQLKQWLFLYSDEVFIDGEPISKADRAMIAASGFNMRPEPKSIEVSETCQGWKMEEAEFIEYEKKRIESISVGAGEISTKKGYLDYLNERAKAETKRPAAGSDKKRKTHDKAIIGYYAALLKLVNIEVGTDEVVCRKICGLFKKEYTDTMRQAAGKRPTNKHLKKIREQIFPLIDTDTRQRIEQYLQAKQKVYG